MPLLLEPLVLSMKDLVAYQNSDRDGGVIAKLVCPELRSVDAGIERRVGKHRYVYPSHQLLADALEGLHLLPRSLQAVQLVDLFAVYLMLNAQMYTSPNVSTRPGRALHRAR